MSRESILGLIERVESDEEFRNRLLALPAGAARDFVAASGYDVGPSDLVHLRDVADLDELSDDDLERISAGGTATTVGETIGVGIGATVGGLGAGGTVALGVLAAAAASEML